jgi:hypothetical protein
VIMAAGVTVRVFRLTWGLPEFDHPDGVMYFVRPAASLVALGEWMPPHFVHPPLLVYVTALVYAAWSWVTGTPVAPAGRPFYAQFPTLVLLGRSTSVAISVATIALIYVLARRLVGSRAALLGAAVFAVAPLPVLEAHRINPDAPLVFLTLLATLVAVLAHERERRALLLAAFFLGGLAGGFKYNGPAAAAVPAWVTLTWPGAEPWRRRLAWLSAGAALTALGFALGCLPAFFNWRKAWTTASDVIRFSYVIGMPGVDLLGHGWTYTRYVYALVVALPYMMGWTAYLAALAGLVLLVRHRPRAAGIVLAFVVPYFAIMGGAIAIVARYYLPLAPYLALAAGVGLDWWFDGPVWRRRAGVVVAAVVLGYSLVLDFSQCSRLGLGPQRQLAALIAQEVEHRPAPDAPLKVAYPNLLVLYYDAIRPLVERIPHVAWTYYPAEYQNVRAERGETPPDEELRGHERRWIRDNDVAVVILPSWIEHGVMRERPDGATAHFYRHLADGSLGFRLGGEFRTRFWTQALYTWGDPMLDTHWETAIAGYKVFVRTGDEP